MKIIYRKHIAFKGVNFRHRFNVLIDGGTLKIGRKCFFNNGCSINCMDEINIGENCIFGENVLIYDHNHKFGKGVNLIDGGFSTKIVTIGNNVWVGSGCIILAGTVIGDNVVIAAGLTVSGDIPANTLVRRGKQSFYFEELR